MSETNERETCIVSNHTRIIETYLDEVPESAYFGECDTTGSIILYVDGNNFEKLTVIHEYK